MQVDTEAGVEWYIEDNYTMKEFDTEDDSDCEDEAGLTARGKVSFVPGVAGWALSHHGEIRGVGEAGEGPKAAATTSPQSTAVFAQAVSTPFETYNNVHFEMEKGDAALRRLAGSVGTLAKDMADLRHYVSALEHKLVSIEGRKR